MTNIHDVKAQIQLLNRLQRADVVGKDKNSLALKGHLETLLNELPLAGGAAFEILGESGDFASVLYSIIASHENLEIVSIALRLIGDLTEPEAYEGNDRNQALRLVDRLMDDKVVEAVAGPYE